MFWKKIYQSKNSVQQTPTKTKIGLKDLSIDRNGVLSTRFTVILETQSAKDQIKALKEVKIKDRRNGQEATVAG